VPMALGQPRSDVGRAFRGLAAIYVQAAASNGSDPARNGRRKGLLRRGS
jgi:hypothetical protein